MKRFLIIFLALVMVGCAAQPAPTQPVAAQPEPSQTPLVVVITATNPPPTEPPPPTEVPPTEVPPTEVPPTAVPPTAAPPTSEVAAPAPTQEAADPNAPITIDDKLGGGWFLGITRSGNNISLRCQLYKELKFTVKATSDDIRNVDFWYRIEDRGSGAIFEWVNAGKMIPDNEGNYTFTFSGEKIHANFRNFDLGWLDFQFIGYNPTGVVGRSEKIERQVTYTKECPQ